MNKFYGGVVCKPAGNVRRQISGISVEDSPDTPHASTYQGPSREGISGERAAPDSGTAQEHAPDWRYFQSHTYEELSRGF